VIEDPNPFVSHHEAALLGAEALASELAEGEQPRGVSSDVRVAERDGAAFASPDHPATDLAIDHPHDHNDPHPGDGSTRIIPPGGDRDPDPGEDGGRGPRA
jgi:hypothetical protein